MIEAGILTERRCELIEGEIVEMPPEGDEHIWITEGIGDYLQSLLAGSAWIREDRPITLPNSSSEPQPDIAVLRLPRERYRYRRPGPEDIYWLIEVADTTFTKDTGEKLKIYAAADIPEYWVIDVQRSQVRVFHQPSGEKYQREVAVTAGTISPLAFPNLNISVERLLKGSYDAD